MKQIIVYVSLLIVAFMMVPGAYAFSGSSPHSNSTVGNLLPPYIQPHAIITIINNVNGPTPSNYNEKIVVNSSQYAFFENSNLSNIWFSYSNGTVISSWLQSGNSYADNNTTYWLKLHYSLAISTYVNIYMNFLPLGEIAFNGVTTGEAPQLSKVYGQYDNGAHVFNFYDNFAGTTLNSSKWISTGSGAGTSTANEIVNNSLHFPKPQNIYTKESFNYSSIVESYGLIGPGGTNNNSFYINGVGFSSGGYDCTNAEISSGWATNSSNGPGMSQWVSNGITYTYNYSKSINSSMFHIYGINMVNSSYYEGIVNSQIENVSHLGFPSNPKSLNATIGFQTDDFSKNNTFYWVLVRNSTSNGLLNLPYTVNSKGYNIKFEPVGLPANATWTGSIDGITMNGTGVENISATLINGSYAASFSASNGYEAYPSSVHFTISGVQTTLYKIYFESPANQTYLKAVSTFSAKTNTQMPGFVYNFTSNGITSPIYSSAMDQNTGKIFTTLICENKILEYNPSNGSASVFSTKIAEPSSIYYDGQNNLLYVNSAVSGNLSMIDASNGTIEKNVSLKHTQSNLTYIVPGSNPGSLYVITYSPFSATTISNVYLVGLNGTVLKNVFYNNIPQISLMLSPPATYHGSLIISNGSGLLELNPVNGTQKYVPFPKGFDGVNVLNYVKADLFLVSDQNLTNTPNMIFNASTSTFEKGLAVNGMTISDYYNNQTGIAYVQSANITTAASSIFAIKASSGQILASAPYFYSISNKMLFNSSNNNLYITNNMFNSNEAQYIHVFSTSSTYTVTFKATGLESGASWTLNINGTNHTVAGSEYTVTGINGTSYSYSIYNNSLYYTSGVTSGTVSIKGSDIIVTLAFNHYSYIIGNFTQKGLNVTINGVVHNVGNSSFNLTVVAGTYHVIISDPGYVTQYVNFTLAPGVTENLSATLNKTVSPAGPVPITYYYAAGIIVLIVAAGAVVYMRRK